MDFPVSQPDVGLVGGVFVDENAVTGQPGSRIPATWGNAVTKELLNVLQEAGIEPDESDTGQVAAAILKMISEAGGMPRFTPYVWGGRGDAMPEGDTQSSGQQLLDLMYPTMRSDVVATQFTCTEAEWQADPYKRVTHWSLGDGVSWMRPPDKNGVQPGNVGAFYGAGSNPAGGKTGTAVIDAMRNIKGYFTSRSNFNGSALEAGGSFASSLDAGGASGANLAGVASQGKPTGMVFDASLALPPGTTTDPIAGEFRPRTFYGIWMIRMYGRVVNTGLLDAPALNARMDMIDARVANLEGRHKAMGDGNAFVNVTASRVVGTNYTNLSGRMKRVSLTGTSTAANGYITVVAGGVGKHAYIPVVGWANSVSIDVWPGQAYSYAVTNATVAKIEETQ